MKINKYNQGGRTAMYDMLRKYMEGGKMYEHGGEHGDPTGKTTSKGFRIIPTERTLLKIWCAVEEALKEKITES